MPYQEQYGSKKMTLEPKKPEWFEITESDNASAAVTKVNKKLPVIAVLATAAIIGAGAFFANASESPSANAENVSPVAAATPSASATSAPSASPTASTGIANPAPGGIQAPQGRGDGDGDHEFGDRPHHDGDRDGREHHEGGEQERD
jgi:hypothetical protein